MCVLALRMLLAVLGVLMVVAGRVSTRFRRQVTRDVCVEISSDDGVTQQFVFHARSRTMTWVLQVRAPGGEPLPPG